MFNTLHTVAPSFLTFRVQAAERLGNPDFTNHLIHNNSYGPRSLPPASRSMDVNAGSSHETPPVPKDVPPVPPQPASTVPQQSTANTANPASGNGGAGGDKPRVDLVLNDEEEEKNKRRRKILVYLCLQYV